MKSRSLVFVLMFIAATFAHAAIDVAGVKFEDKARVGQTELALNGAGLRAKFIFKVYAVGLYLSEKKTAAADAVAQKGAKRLLIVGVRRKPRADIPSQSDGTHTRKARTLQLDSTSTARPRQVARTRRSRFQSFRLPHSVLRTR